VGGVVGLEVEAVGQHHHVGDHGAVAGVVGEAGVGCHDVILGVAGGQVGGVAVKQQCAARGRRQRAVDAGTEVVVVVVAGRADGGAGVGGAAPAQRPVHQAAVGLEGEAS